MPRLKNWQAWLFRLIGLALLAWLLLLVDLGGALSILAGVDLSQVVLAALLVFPLIGLKSLRWLLLIGMRLDSRSYFQATAAYFSGLFLGFLTPGRLGEFIRIVYARNHLDGDTVRAALSVLVDRFLDLAALMIIGGFAILELAESRIIASALGWGIIILGASTPVLIILLAEKKLLPAWISERDWKIAGFELGEVLSSIAQLKVTSILLGVGLTAIAYALFFGQGLLLADAIELPLNYPTVAASMALASLAALLPISVSGLGTREWALSIYLGRQGLEFEKALAFSALIFLIFNLWGSLLGALSWILYPDWLRPSTGDPSEIDDIADEGFTGRWIDWGPKGN